VRRWCCTPVARRRSLTTSLKMVRARNAGCPELRGKGRFVGEVPGPKDTRGDTKRQLRRRGQWGRATLWSALARCSAPIRRSGARSTSVDTISARPRTSTPAQGSAVSATTTLTRGSRLICRAFASSLKTISSHRLRIGCWTRRDDQAKARCGQWAAGLATAKRDVRQKIPSVRAN
jgi:hypothetical protein